MPCFLLRPIRISGNITEFEIKWQILKLMHISKKVSIALDTKAQNIRIQNITSTDCVILKMK